MEKIKTIIVDDEPEARDVLANLLADFSDLEVLSKDTSVDEALQSVQKHQPDLIFLDIQMPGKDGFELVRKLKGGSTIPTVIFITAYDQFAIEAIRHAAFDYLLKPVDIDELKASIQRYKDQVRDHAPLSRIENLLQALQEEKIRFSTRSGTLYLNPSDIVYCQAGGNYSDLHLADGEQQTVTMNIGRLEELLPPARFSKINRSVIVNRQYLSEIRRKERVCTLKTKAGEISLGISPRYIQLLGMD